MKIRPEVAELSRGDRGVDGHTDMTQPVITFRNSANAHTNDICE